MKALELDDSLGEAHASLAFFLDLFDWNWEAAEKEFRRAIDLNLATQPLTTGTPGI